jgi:hypothetical protein
MNWIGPHFVRLCSNHLILPVIYLKFKAHKLIEHLPDELAEFLKEIYDLINVFYSLFIFSILGKNVNFL